MPRPLPRSLEPLPDESIIGYLLRLAFRLQISPKRLAELTGLTTGHHHPGISVFALTSHAPSATQQAFATATRLTTTETANLFLSAFGRRHQATAAPTKPRSTSSPNSTESWLFTRSTRYCPDCLAGDGTEIQRHLGGPWRRTWRIPIVFACTLHQRFLQHLCPSCQQPVHHRPSLTHLRRWTNSSLHPTQCRYGTPTKRPTYCEHRLTEPTADATTLTAPLLNLQHHLLTALAPAGPATVDSLGRPTTPPRYFKDLQLTSYLICTTWPLARDYVPTDSLATTLENYLHDEQRTTTLHNGTRVPLPSYGLKQLHKTPPLDAHVGAALLATADQLLRLGSPNDLVATFEHLIRSDRPRADEPIWRTSDPLDKIDCSHGLDTALRSILEIHTHSRRDRKKQTERHHLTGSASHAASHRPGDNKDL